MDLATLAEKMDDEERIRMAESGIDSDEYRRFMQVCNIGGFSLFYLL